MRKCGLGGLWSPALPFHQEESELVIPLPQGGLTLALGTLNQTLSLCRDLSGSGLFSSLPGPLPPPSSRQPSISARTWFCIWSIVLQLFLFLFCIWGLVLQFLLILPVGPQRFPGFLPSGLCPDSERPSLVSRGDSANTNCSSPQLFVSLPGFITRGAELGRGLREDLEPHTF